MRGEKLIFILVITLIIIPFASSSSFGVDMQTESNQSIFGVNMKSLAASVATTFLGLTDTPAAYTGAEGYCVKVNTTTNALFFGLCSSGTNSWWSITGYLYNNSGSLDVNQTLLNETIDDRVGNITGGGGSYNVTYDADLGITYNSTYDSELGVMYNTSYESTYNATYDADLGITYNSTYDSELGVMYNSSYEGSYNTTYDSDLGITYNATYDGELGVMYNSSYEGSYNATYDSNVDTNDSAYIEANQGAWNSTYNSTYDSDLGITYNSTYDSDLGITYNATYDSNVDTNDSSYIDANQIAWNSTYNSTYDSDLGITYNATYDTWAYNQTLGLNATQLENVGGTISIIQSWIESLIDFSTIWTAIAGNSTGGGNESFNKTYTDDQYVNLTGDHMTGFLNISDALEVEKNITTPEGLEFIGNATIKRRGVDSKLWYSENGDINIQFGT